MADQLRFIHLSDIHFHKKEKDSYHPYDLDEDLRDQLELDAERMSGAVGSPDGIIISGDVAFAGREAEYDQAHRWLKRLCDKCRCNPAAVWCVPGNHDADRSVFPKSLNLRNLHKTLRPAQPSDVDAALAEVLEDTETAATLFRPLEQYNRFASVFACPTHPSKLAWDQEVEQKLNDGSVVRLWGANSALVSDESDDNKGQKLILGTLQTTPAERPGQTVIFICHHSPDWLIDCDQILPNLKARAHIQLFGHKHMQTVDHTNNCLRIVAGAIQPDRREPKWRPRYNWLGLSVLRDGPKRKLIITVWPRVWSEHEPKFVADHALCGGQEQQVHVLDLSPWQPPIGPAAPDASETAVQVRIRADPAPVLPRGSSMDAAKTLTYRFLSLPHLVRLEIAQTMQLLREDDEGLFDAELFERILTRASEAKQLGELWNQVATYYPDKQPTGNPYAGR